MAEFKVVLAVPVQMSVEAADHEKAISEAIDQLEGLAEVVPGYDVHCLECARLGRKSSGKKKPASTRAKVTSEEKHFDGNDIA